MHNIEPVEPEAPIELENPEEQKPEEELNEFNSHKRGTYVKIVIKEF